MSRMLPRCSIWLIPTKTLGDLSQFSGRLFSFLSNFLQVLSTISCFIAFLPYFWLVKDRSNIRHALMVASQWLCISNSFGHSFSGLSLWILLHLSFHMRWALLDTRILYVWLSPLRIFPPHPTTSMSPHPAIQPILISPGQASCFLSHNLFIIFQTISCPGTSHCRRICFRSFITPHFSRLALWP